MADSDELDGCSIDFEAFAVDEDTEELLPLFPDCVDDPIKAQFWRDLAREAGERFVPEGFEVDG